MPLLFVAMLAGCAHQPSAQSASEPPAARYTAADQQPSLETEKLTDVRIPPIQPGGASVEREREEYADLFQRMRSGFALPQKDHVAVRREIEWYLGHSAFLGRSFGRGRRYLHHIVETLEERNMPRELALLPVIESGFDPFARSRRSALGLWQFIPETGRRYGLEKSRLRDDRRDVLDATRAALDHLAELHETFDGDWLLALAAYNAGEVTVRRAVDRNQRLGRPIEFFALELPEETRRYVPKLLALSRLVAEPETFGIALPAIPNAPYFARVDIEHQVDLGRVADLAEIPRDELRALNPAFDRGVTAPGRSHQLLVPASAKTRFESVLSTSPPRERLLHHRVRRGDTLSAIARQHGISVETLRTVNRVRGSLIHPGQDLLVPLSYGTGVAVGG